MGVALALTATACGSSSAGRWVEGAPAATTTSSLVASPTPYGEVVGGRVVINIVDLMFQPDEVEVPEGTTAIFTNNDQVPHSVTKSSGPGTDFDSGPIEPGGTYQQILRESGSVRIEDTESSDTTMTIRVESAP